MQVVHSPDAMQVVHSPDAMQVVHSPDAMQVVHSPDAMQVVHSPDAMQVVHSPTYSEAAVALQKQNYVSGEQTVVIRGDATMSCRYICGSSSRQCHEQETRFNNLSSAICAARLATSESKESFLDNGVVFEELLLLPLGCFTTGKDVVQVTVNSAHAGAVLGCLASPGKIPGVQRVCACW
eukprot:Lankesteria_metandrocarpae@DN124_c0_g1_i2.p1